MDLIIKCNIYGKIYKSISIYDLFYMNHKYFKKYKIDEYFSKKILSRNIIRTKNGFFIHI